MPYESISKVMNSLNFEEKWVILVGKIKLIFLGPNNLLRSSHLIVHVFLSFLAGFPYEKPYHLTTYITFCSSGNHLLNGLGMAFLTIVKRVTEEKVLEYDMIHPRKLTWNLEMMVSNRNLLFQGSIFRFHVCFGGCSYPNTINESVHSVIFPQKNKKNTTCF